MAKILYYGTAGSDDPTRAVFPFLFAGVAKEAGHEVEVTVMGEAVYLMHEHVAGATRGVGFPGVSEVIQKAVKLGVPIWV